MRKRNFTKQVGLILSEETYSRLIEQTNKEEMTVSNWIRQAIEAKLTFNGFNKETQTKDSRKEHQNANRKLTGID